MIGGDLKTYGDKWAAGHGEQLGWLQTQGVSREQAIARHDEWWEAKLRSLDGCQ